MNRKELAMVLGVSPTAIGHWEKEGMPVITKAGQGSPNDYNLEECLVWIKKHGKGQSVRVDRPGAETRINALTNTIDSNGTPPVSDFLMLTEKELQDAINFGEMLGRKYAFEWIGENFLIAASSLIRFGGVDPEPAVNLGFHIAYSLRNVGCMVHEIERQDPDPESRAAHWLKGDKGALDKFAVLACEMQDLWTSKHSDHG